jgi:hypothetical protein
MNFATKHTHWMPFLRAGILAAALTLAALACDLPGWPTPTATSVPPGVPAGWICYQNATYGFEVCYPPDATISTASPEHSRLDLSITPGTTLLTKEMDVDSGAGWTTCESPQTAGYGGGSYPGTTQTIAGLEFLVQSGEQGTAGQYHRWTGYSTEKDGVCVSLTGILHSANPMVYSTPPPDYDITAESAVFAQIVSTFRWLDAATPTMTPTSPVPAGWACYQNALYAFEVCYPADATLSDETADHVRIDLTFIPGTNLQEKWVDVNGRNTPPDCESPQVAGYTPASITEETRTIAGLSFLVQSGGEGAVGNYYNWTGYSTEKDGVCASLTGILHSTNPLMYPTPPPEFDLTAEGAVFEQIADTFRWLDEAASTPPTDDSPTASFTANTNCRRGASIDHEIVTFLREGQTAPIVGRNEDGSWWLIQVPGTAVRCWVWGKFVTPHGDISRAPFVESPVLGCWYQGRDQKKPKCVAPCPDGAMPGGVCEP